jgi:ubiquinone/menaquinone biosynthesis C-methylase UbiE
MVEINLLKSLPKTKRNIKNRFQKKTKEEINEALKFDKMYFDGPRSYGYGGYKYDGRWIPVARDIKKHFNLKKGDKLLDVGCAKGFLVKDLCDIGIDAYGVDISKYALQNCMLEIKNKLSIASADNLTFDTSSFDCVISINTIHNLNKKNCIKALKEIMRVSKGKSFVQVDSYRNVKEKELFEKWVLTAKFHDYPDEWVKIFNSINYDGDWYWTLL